MGLYYLLWLRLNYYEALGRLSVHHFLNVPNIVYTIWLSMHLNIFKVHYKHDIFVILFEYS